MSNTRSGVSMRATVASANKASGGKKQTERKESSTKGGKKGC